MSEAPLKIRSVDGNCCKCSQEESCELVATRTLCSGVSYNVAQSQSVRMSSKPTVWSTPTGPFALRLSLSLRPSRCDAVAFTRLATNPPQGSAVHLGSKDQAARQGILYVYEKCARAVPKVQDEQEVGDRQKLHKRLTSDSSKYLLCDAGKKSI